MNLKNLVVFLTVAKYGNMSLAAKELFISQPTVSQIILSLEEEFNTILFDRFPKTLHLTESGEILQAFSQKVLGSYDSLNEAMHSIDKPSLRLGATFTVAATLLADLVKFHQDKNIGSNTTVKVENTDEIENMLLNDQLDFALVEGQINNRFIHTNAVFNDELVLIVGRNHKFAKKEFINLEDLNNEDLLMREKGSGTRELLEMTLESQNINVNVLWESHCPTAIIKAVANDLGISFLSPRITSIYVDQGKIIVVPIKNFKMNRQFYLCRHKNKSYNLSMTLFEESISEFKLDPLASKLYS